jgi:hypothetical protein
MAELGHKQGTNFTFEFVQVANVGDYEGDTCVRALPSRAARR